MHKSRESLHMISVRFLTALKSEYPGIGLASKGGDLTIQPSQSTSDKRDEESIMFNLVSRPFGSLFFVVFSCTFFEIFVTFQTNLS